VSPAQPLRAPHPALVAALRSVALASETNKLRALQDAALHIWPLIVKGEVAKPDAVDTLCQAADNNGLYARYTRGDIEHVIGMGLLGVATLLPATSTDFVAKPSDAREDERRQQRESDRRDELVTVCAADIKPKRLEWFWPNRFARGKVGILGGHPDEGKSLILADMIARTTRGDGWPCGEGSAPIGNAILLTAEDDLDDTVIPRLIAAGADLKRVYIIQMVEKADGGSRTFSLLTDLEMLERKIAEIGSVVFVGVDPLSAYFGVGKMDAYRTTDVRGVMTPLAALAQKENLTVVGVLHFNKNVNVTNAMLRFSDSLAFVAAARHAFVVTKDPAEERRLFLKAKNNLAADSKGLAYSFQAPVVATDAIGDMVAPCIAWSTQHVDMTAAEALAAAVGGNDESTDTDDAADFLRKVLADGPLAVKEAERQAVEAGLLAEGRPIGQSKPFRTARKTLGIITDKGGMREGWTWALPKMPFRAEDAS
jgi:putative DNA primase/helicase